MTEKTVPWWRSFVGKRRKAARESAAKLEQELASNATSPTVTSTTTESHAKQEVPQAQQQAGGGSSLLNDDTYDDSAVQPTFNENSNRRKMRVSRSGRFKEKRHDRVGLPQNYKDSSDPDGKGQT